MESLQHIKCQNKVLGNTKKKKMQILQYNSLKSLNDSYKICIKMYENTGMVRYTGKYR